MTTVHPAARAGPNFLVIIALGKFHGLLLLSISTLLRQEKRSYVAMNTGPIACLMTTLRRLDIELGITSPYVLRDSSAEESFIKYGSRLCDMKTHRTTKIVQVKPKYEWRSVHRYKRTIPQRKRRCMRLLPGDNLSDITNDEGHDLQPWLRRRVYRFPVSK